MSDLKERLRHQWGWDNSAAALRLEAANHIAELEAEVKSWNAEAWASTRALADERAKVKVLEAKVERLNRFNDELAADKFRLLKEIRAMDQRIPDPDDLRRILERAAGNREGIHPHYGIAVTKEAEKDILAGARLRATLEVKDE
jgi:hypothetical protein